MADEVSKTAILTLWKGHIVQPIEVAVRSGDETIDTGGDEYDIAHDIPFLQRVLALSKLYSQRQLCAEGRRSPLNIECQLSGKQTLKSPTPKAENDPVRTARNLG
jgi:hypothetical protein